MVATFQPVELGAICAVLQDSKLPHRIENWKEIGETKVLRSPGIVLALYVKSDMLLAQGGLSGEIINLSGREGIPRKVRQKRRNRK